MGLPALYLRNGDGEAAVAGGGLAVPVAAASGQAQAGDEGQGGERREPSVLERHRSYLSWGDQGSDRLPVPAVDLLRRPVLPRMRPEAQER